MRSHLRGGRLAMVFGIGAAAALGLAACTFEPRYPIDPNVAPGAGAQQIMPRYSIHEGDAHEGGAPADEAAAPTPRRAAPPPEPAEGQPLAPRAPVESSDLPPPPASAAYIVGEDGPMLIRAAVHRRKSASATKESAPKDDDAPTPGHGRRKATAPAPETTPETTTVKAGENLYRISLRTHVSVEALAKLNHIKPPYAVKAGRVLDVSSAAAQEAQTTSGDEAVHTRHGPGFREETASELRAEKAEQRRLERQEAAEPATKRGRKSEVVETAAARKPSPAPSPVAPEDLLPPAPARTPPAAARPVPPRPPEVAAAPTSGPRPYAEVFGAASGSVRVASGRGRGGRTHEDAAAAVAAAAARHPTLGAAATAANTSAAAPVASPPSAYGRFIWPVRGEVISGFGPLASGTRSDGLDLSAVEGDPVHAAAGGEVVYAGGAIPGFGNLVLIKHAGGYVTAYGHLQRIEVAMRQTVSQGQVLGEAGSTGAVAKPELHFEIRYSPSPDQSAKPVDPAPLLPPKG